MNFCECGCGALVKNRFASGHNTRVEHPLRGLGHSKKTRKLISKNTSLGMKNGSITRACVCGCEQTFECKATSKKRFVNSGHVHRGREKSEQTKLKMSLARKGKTYIDLFGEEKAKEIGKKISIGRVGKPSPAKGKTLEEIMGNVEKAKLMKEQISQTLTGRKLPPFSKEHRKNMRTSAVKRIEKLNGKCQPSCNPKACELFKSLDERENTKGRYAIYGGGEYYIKELGYFLDYINFSTKVIREYDEPSHYDVYNNLKQKDIRRQQEIQEHYPDFKFERIRE